MPSYRGRVTGNARDVCIVEDAIELEESHNGRFTRGAFLPHIDPEPVVAEDEDDPICDDYWPEYYSSSSPFRRRSGYE